VRIANATLSDGSRCDIIVEAGRVVALPPASGEPVSGDDIDLGGALTLPPLVDGHIHLDKTLLGLDWIPNEATGDRVIDRIEAERRVRAARTVPEFVTGSALVRQVVASGTLHLRTHVDIDNQLGLRNLHEILKVRERYRDLVTMQIVAFPQSGILRSPGTAELLDAAIREGADLVGGLDPLGIDGDADAHLNVVFAIAARRGVGVDIHLHDGGENGLMQIQAIAERTRATGLQGKVAISHAFALGAAPPDAVRQAVKLLAETDIAIMTHGPGAAAMPPIRQLHEQGVRVFAGSDNIRDAWSPFGNGDMLERAATIAYRANLRRDEDLRFAFDIVTRGGVRGLGLDDYGLIEGGPADLFAVDVPSLPEAVVRHPVRKLVMRAGRVVARDGVLLDNAA
jgi:cytosine deaminase